MTNLTALRLELTEKNMDVLTSQAALMIKGGKGKTKKNTKKKTIKGSGGTTVIVNNGCCCSRW